VVNVSNYTIRAFRFKAFAGFLALYRYFIQRQMRNYFSAIKTLFREKNAFKSVFTLMETFFYFKFIPVEYNLAPWL
jgi:hypothetical protein